MQVRQSRTPRHVPALERGQCGRALALYLYGGDRHGKASPSRILSAMCPTRPQRQFRTNVTSVKCPPTIPYPMSQSSVVRPTEEGKRTTACRAIPNHARADDDFEHISKRRRPRNRIHFDIFSSTRDARTPFVLRKCHPGEGAEVRRDSVGADW